MNYTYHALVKLTYGDFAHVTHIGSSMQDVLEQYNNGRFTSTPLYIWRDGESQVFSVRTKEMYIV